MENNDKLAVTVAVYTYNSSETVVETLDSILSQTYPKLELIISDDGSTDNTVDICRKWLEEHHGRFVNARLLTVKKNTGTSANGNRAWDACETTWIKDIAGDDLLLPNCIEDNMAYIQDHPDAIMVFSRLTRFMVKDGRKVAMDEWSIDYSIFELGPEERCRRLMHEDGVIPTGTCFANIEELRRLGFRHDERIPLLEDAPKWLALSRKGIEFHFMDKLTVYYRYNWKSLGNGINTPAFYKSFLFYLLYYFLDEIKNGEDQDAVYSLISDKATERYEKTYNRIAQLNDSFKNSWDFRIGHFVLAPLRFLKHGFSRK